MFTISTELADTIMVMCKERVNCKVGITDAQGRVLAKNKTVSETRIEQAARLSIRRGQTSALNIDDKEGVQFFGAPLIIGSRVLVHHFNEIDG